MKRVSRPLGSLAGQNNKLSNVGDDSSAVMILLRDVELGVRSRPHNEVLLLGELLSSIY